MPHFFCFCAEGALERRSLLQPSGVAERLFEPFGRVQSKAQACLRTPKHALLGVPPAATSLNKQTATDPTNPPNATPLILHRSVSKFHICLAERTPPVTGSQSDPKRTAKTSSRKITKKVWIRASRDVVYGALTDAKELVQWFCDRASFDPHEGGELVAQWRGEKNGQKGRAVVTRVVPGSILELLWTDDGRQSQERGSDHTLGYEIRSKSGLTELIMTDRDEFSDDEETSVFDQGWNLVLLELKDHCERKERSAKLRTRSGSRAGKADPA
jgi:uncharacterized protein YndB with AHSA1/START domain